MSIGGLDMILCPICYGATTVVHTGSTRLVAGDVVIDIEDKLICIPCMITVIKGVPEEPVTITVSGESSLLPLIGGIYGEKSIRTGVPELRQAIGYPLAQVRRPAEMPALLWAGLENGQPSGRGVCLQISKDRS